MKKRDWILMGIVLTSGLAFLSVQTPDTKIGTTRMGGVILKKQPAVIIFDNTPRTGKQDDVVVTNRPVEPPRPVVETPREEPKEGFYSAVNNNKGSDTRISPSKNDEEVQPPASENHNEGSKTYIRP